MNYSLMKKIIIICTFFHYVNWSTWKNNFPQLSHSYPPTLLSFTARASRCSSSKINFVNSLLFTVVLQQRFGANCFYYQENCLRPCRPTILKPPPSEKDSLWGQNMSASYNRDASCHAIAQLLSPTAPPPQFFSTRCWVLFEIVWNTESR